MRGSGSIDSAEDRSTTDHLGAISGSLGRLGQLGEIGLELAQFAEDAFEQLDYLLIGWLRLSHFSPPFSKLKIPIRYPAIFLPPTTSC